MKEIKLSKFGKNRGKYVALVDDEDFEYLNQFNWFAHYSPGHLGYYVRGHIGKKIISIHRALMANNLGLQVDHKDGNGLNNQRSNLRLCTCQQNQRNRFKSRENTSGFKGVSNVKKRYINRDGISTLYLYIIACIRYNKKNIYLGTFKTKEDAAMAYDEAAKRYHGEFANLNFK